LINKHFRRAGQHELISSRMQEALHAKKKQGYKFETSANLTPQEKGRKGSKRQSP
jgi:DNA invertase Pin-like site-specific DNA recombinase